MDWITTSTILNDLRDLENEAAWGAFVGRFRIPVVRFVTGLGYPSTDAEDVCQETLSTFAETLRTGRYDREKGRLRSWLFGIAYKQALKFRDRERRHRRRVLGGTAAEKAVLVVPDEKNAVDLWNLYWDRYFVQQCFERIRVEYEPASVRVFELVVLEERTPQEAADETGLTIRAVYNAKHRILKRMRTLREELEEME